MDPADSELHAGIEARPFEGGAVLELSGMVDVSSAVRLHEEALRLASGGGAVIVDWAGCRYLDAAALQTLLALKRRLDAAGGSLRVGRDAPAIRAWLAMAGASKLLPAPDETDRPTNARRS
ncbi:MAG: STAS domain-containing protein [Bryobacteraceae bacterium]|jgi:anti-anti-sigma factor